MTSNFLCTFLCQILNNSRGKTLHKMIESIHKFLNTYNLSDILPARLVSNSLHSPKRERTNCSELKAKSAASLECKFYVSRYGGSVYNLSRFLIRKRSLRQRAAKLRACASWNRKEMNGKAEATKEGKMKFSLSSLIKSVLSLLLI